MVDIHNGYQFLTPIVGESHYFDVLKRCYFDENAYRKGKAVFIDVRLYMEDDNPYDNQAVAVISPYGTIGHLSRNIARRYRQDYPKDSCQNLSVRAKIYSSNGEIFGVWVDLEYDENTRPRRDKTANNSTKTQKTVTATKTQIHTPTPKKKGLLARLFNL